MLQRFSLNLGFYVAITIALLKVLIIDIDLPEWSIGMYQPIDELYYVTPAYNLLESGNVFGKEIPHLYGIPVIANIITFITLKLFGDNYLGVRLSSIIFGLISLTLFYLLLKRLTTQKLVLFFLPILFSINFSFTLASIVVEPTIGRMAMMLIVIYGVVWMLKKHLAQPKNIFFLGVISAILVILTYPTNAFTLAGIALSLTLSAAIESTEVGYKEFWSKVAMRLFFFGAGIITGLFVYFILSGLAGMRELEAISYSNSSFSDRVGTSFLAIWNNFSNVVWGNIFLFNPMLLVSFFSSLIFSWARKVHYWSSELIVIYSFSVAFLIQCAFINDYPQRKLIIVLPLVLLLVIGTCYNVYEYFLLANCKGKNLVTRLIILNLTIWVFLIILYFRFKAPYLLVSVGFLVMYLILLTIILYVIIRKSLNIYLLQIVFILLLIPELVKDNKYFLLNKSYYFKEALEKLDKYKDARFIGGFSIGFQLYNNIRPSINYYSYYDDRSIYWKEIDVQAKSIPEKTYSIGYSTQAEDFKKINFYPKEILLKGEFFIEALDIVVYERKDEILY